MTIRTKIAAGDGDSRHGTVNGYANLGCRCESCRAAWATASKKYRRNRITLLPYRANTLSHGSANTYTNHGCRCLACREAKAAYVRKLRAAAS